MISTTSQAASRPAATAPCRWRIAAGLAGIVGGAVMVAGAFLPWVEIFAGLIGIPGVRGGNGRILAAAGAGIAAVGAYHLLRGRRWPRWLIASGGFAALGFSGYQLVQLGAAVKTFGRDSMVLAHGGPGLWVTAAGALLAFGTMFLPAPPDPTASPRSPSPGGAVRSAALRAEVVRIRLAVQRRTADLESGGARRGVQIALGLIWLLDTVLQLQPQMFGPGFASMLAASASGNPAPVASPALWASRLISHDVAAWNTAFALIQLAIAAGLLWRSTVKAALAGSVAWSLAVWWLGEGLGALLTGTASPVTGAPGAVILYALIAVLAWPARSGDHGGGSVAAASPLGRQWSRAAWLLLWGGMAYLILQPAVRAPRTLSGAISAGAAGEPGWLAALDHTTATAIGSHGLAVSAVLAAVFLLIAAGILYPATTRPAVILGAVTGLALWVAGENFGQILTGMGTDPNTGPLLILLAAAYWPLRPKTLPRSMDPAVATPAGQLSDRRMCPTGGRDRQRCRGPARRIPAERLGRG